MDVISGIVSDYRLNSLEGKHQKIPKSYSNVWFLSTEQKQNIMKPHQTIPKSFENHIKITQTSYEVIRKNWFLIMAPLNET